MAFPATHIHFAMDLAQHFSIQDLPAYYAGTLYPDSRYFTQVAREATHGVPCPHDPFAVGLTDFERGWATHLLYDETVGSEQQAIIPETYPRTRADGGMDDWWVYLTALKIIEDQQNAQEPILQALRSARSEQAPSGEDVQRLEAYYSLIARLYTQLPGLESYDRYMQQLHIPEHRLRQVLEMVSLLSEDALLVSQIAEMYPRQVKKTLTHFLQA